jgi:hypothetical protein
VLVDHVQELEPPPIGGGIELEIHGPPLVRVFGLMTPHRAVRCRSSFRQSRCTRLWFTRQPSRRSKR